MLEDVVDELRGVAGRSRDGSGYFPAMYAYVTDLVARRCAADDFADPARMAAFVDAFAGYYTRALADPEAAPLCWRASWDVAGDRDLLVVQHLLLGINAHVNHDLPQVVVDLADQSGDLASLRGDFDAINDVLGAAFGEVIGRLDRVARWTSEVMTLGGGRAFNFSLRVGRRQAWGAAERLYVESPAGRRAYVAELDRLCGVLGYLVTAPHRPYSVLLPLARRFEERDPRRVTATLLGPAPAGR